MKPEVLEVLRSTKNLFSDPTKWTTGMNARNAKNLAVASRDPEAVKWCVLGAFHCFTPGNIKLCNEVIDTFVAEAGVPYAITINDGPDGYNKVMEVLRRLCEPT